MGKFEAVKEYLWMLLLH